ncbi:MAG: GspE/PulE family protein [Vicinamibacterales bacterium]
MSTTPPAEPVPATLAEAEVSPTVGEEIAQRLVETGAITDDQLAHARRVHEKVGARRTLLAVLTELFRVNESQIRTALRARRVPVALGTLLVELGHISEADLRLALAIQREQPGKRLAEVLAENHFVAEPDAIAILADHLGFEETAPATTPLDPDLVRRAPIKVYRTNFFIPIKRQGDAVLVAFADPMNRRHVEAARRVFGDNLIVGVAARQAVLQAIERAEASQEQDGTPVTAEGAAVKAVNQIILDAIADEVSDIHFEPLRDRLRVRFRQDGTMMPYKDVPLEQATQLVSRLKVLANADIADRRRHQDGRILFQAGPTALDIRFSSYVTVHGEKVVLRLLNNRNRLLTLKDIGMAPKMLQHFREQALDAPSGVVLVTGPTGSGKTTTLYGAINYLNDPKTSIITAEDPVEYLIDGVHQSSINPKINLSYAETLKHIVRQDPDVIVIGEVRDQVSAEIAINSALTGHKVLTTFHTEDSIGGLVRLLNMNIEAFLVSSTVVSVVAQRLLRRVCPHCAEDHPLTRDELRRLGYSAKDGGGIVFKKGRGCPQCRHIGYRGRVGVFELLVLNERIRDAVLSRKTSYEIRRISSETSGLVTMLEDGIAKAAAGLTSFEELIRQLPRLGNPRPVAELNRLLGVQE